MISLTEAMRIYNEDSKTFWDFMIKQLLETEVNKHIPAFVRETLDKEISKLKIRLISKGTDLSEITSSIKKAMKLKRNKNVTLFLIKYVWPEYEKYLEEKSKEEKSKVIFKSEDITVHVKKKYDPEFDFRSRALITKLKFNPKTRSVSFQALCSDRIRESGSSFWYEKEHTADCKIVNYENLLVLLFQYHVMRSGKNYRLGFGYSSDYLVAKGLYILKEPFYVIESEKRFFYASSKNPLSENFNLKEMIKYFKPRYEEDIPIFKNLVKSLKKKDLIPISEKVEKL